MIALLKGTIEARGEGYLIVLCQGVGYKVYVVDAESFKPSSAIVLYTHEAQREDGRELFGFASLDQLEFFWRLIAVSGIGPRGAQKIISSGPVSKIKNSIMTGDLVFLTAISGIGKKTAQKIILELKGVLAEEPSGGAVDEEALQGLVGLGYPRRMAEEALASVEGTGTEARIRGALKILARG